MADEERIPTNLRTLLILEVLGQSDRAMTATEINDQIGLPKQTVHRLCATLEREGFLTRQGDSRRYLPARRLRNLGAGLLYASRLHIARRQILNSVAEATQETVNFVIPENDGMSYLDRVETAWAFRVQLPIGSNVPFHCTASGKCFMASLSPKPRAAFVESLHLEKLTDKTHTSSETLLADLAEVSRRGFASDDEEFIDGMIAIAVPVTDQRGRFVAALAVHGPTLRMDLEGLMEKRSVLLNAAQNLSRAMFSEDDGIE